jgi:LysR family transcriptional regulator, carnitine catabolism transcriptional activator
MLPSPRQIKAFLAVARIGSFTRAASEVGLSQPALTVQIHQLEESVGARLFDRDKRQVRLTAVGEKLVPSFARILADLETVMATGKDIANVSRGQISIAVLPSLSASLIPHCMRRFREQKGGIDVHIHDVVAGKIVQMVKSEEVDFGIGMRLTPDREVDVQDLLSDRLCAFFPQDHPLTSGSLTVRKLTRFPLLLTRQNSSVRILFERVLSREGAEIQIGGEANYMSTVLGMVREGLGVAVLPESAVETGPMTGVSHRPIQAPGKTRKIGIIRRTGCTLSPAADEFVKILCEVAKVHPLSHFTLSANESDGAHSRRKR